MRHEDSGATQPDPQRLDALAESMVNDMGAALGCTLAVIGDRLGLYKALAGAGAMTSAELAERTHLSERMVREWLLSQAASGYVDYQPGSGTYRLTPEQRALLADESSSAFLAGGFQFASAMVKAQERIEECFRDGRGMLWGEHHSDLFEGISRFFRPIYSSKLVDVWIPKVEGLRERLSAGAVVANIGCGYGHEVRVMAQAFPRSHFHGYDTHQPSIEQAKALAAQEGLSDRVAFEVSSAVNFPNRQYDIIAFFNVMHDVGDPEACAAHCYRTLKKDGCVFMIEPLGGHRVEDNFNPVGRFMTGCSVLCCTPHGVASGGEGLGTVVTDEKLRDIMTRAGFRTFHRAATTKYSRILVARP